MPKRSARSADSLLIVINDILDFSKIEAGKLDIEAIELDLRGNVEDVGGMMAFQAAAKNLELVVHVHPDVPERVIGDPQRIRQCLINLVGNAIKFTRAGEIVIEVRSVGRARRQGADAVRSARHRHRHRAETLQDAVPAVRAGGLLDDASLRRHRTRPVDRASPGRDDGRRGRRRKRVGKGSTFWFTLPLEAVRADRRRERAARSDTARTPRARSSTTTKRIVACSPVS